MNNNIKAYPIGFFTLYAIVNILMFLLMKEDPGKARKISMSLLGVGKLVSVLAGLYVLKVLYDLYKSGKTINVKDKNLLLIAMGVIMLYLFQDGNIMIGAAARFDSQDVTMPYLMALNGVGLAGLSFLALLILSITLKKRKGNNKLNLNSSLLPVVVTVALSSITSTILTVLIIIAVILLIAVLVAWAKSLAG
jgi:hypothetical protein